VGAPAASGGGRREPCSGAAKARLGQRGTSSSPRGSRLGLCAAHGRGWLGAGSSLRRRPWRMMARCVREDGRQPLFSRGGSRLSVEGTPP
jgi:hypothetical protein